MAVRIAGVLRKVSRFTALLLSSVANVPYTALGPELTADTDERTSIFFWGKIYAGVGTLIGATSPEIFKAMLGGVLCELVLCGAGTEPTCTLGGEDLSTLKMSFFLVALVFGALYLLFMGYVIYTVRERPQVCVRVCTLLSMARERLIGPCNRARKRIRCLSCPPFYAPSKTRFETERRALCVPVCVLLRTCGVGRKR